MLPTLGLVAVLVLITRPLVAFLATLRADLTRGNVMAPRGIVAAVTAPTFSAQLAAKHVGGASKILPVTFLVIVATVALNGLTAVPVARRVGVARPSRTRPLLVGGQVWVVDLACALASAGLDMLVWAGSTRSARRSGALAWNWRQGSCWPRPLRAARSLMGITAVLLLTDEDDFNALAAAALAGSVEGPVYRARRPPPRPRRGRTLYRRRDPLRRQPDPV